MGHNKRAMLHFVNHLAACSWAKAEGTVQETIRSLLPRLHYFDEGTCIVHHMFGAETTSLVRKAYGDALLTAHFEVNTAPHKHSPDRQTLNLWKFCVRTCSVECRSHSFSSLMLKVGMLVKDSQKLLASSAAFPSAVPGKPDTLILRLTILQVPGEMFTLAMEAKARGRGVVGSTSDILGFIAKHVTSALQQPFLEPLQVSFLVTHPAASPEAA